MSPIQRTTTGEVKKDRDSETFSDHINNKRTQRLRIFVQNVNGIGLKGNTEKSRKVIDTQFQYEADICMMSEIGINWSKIKTNNTWLKRIPRRTKKQRHVFAYNRHEAKDSLVHH